MFRPIAHAFSCCAALAPFAAQAIDSNIDATLNAVGSTPGWVRGFAQGGGSTDERFVAAARAPDGGYVLAGQRYGGTQGALIFLAKFRPNGSYDSGFGGTAATGNAGVGRVVKDAWLTSVTDMTIDAQGRIVVIGATPGALGQDDFGVVRFNPDGTDDLSFAGDGGTSVAFDLDAANNRVNDAPESVTTTPDGSIYVAGTLQRRNVGTAETVTGVVKLKPDGAPGDGFGTMPGGRDFYCCERMTRVARIVYDAPRDRLVIGVDYWVSGTNTDWQVVYHYLHDPEYAVWQTYPIDLGGASGYQFARMSDLVVQPDGKAIALGIANDQFQTNTAVLLRLNSNRSEDTSFGSIAGRGVRVPPWGAMLPYALAVDGLGRILMTGMYGDFRTGFMGRLEPSGAVDFDFNGTYNPSAYHAPTSSLASQAYATRFRKIFFDAGQPLIAGDASYSTSDETDYDLVMTRLQADLIFANGFQ